MAEGKDVRGRGFRKGRWSSAAVDGSVVIRMDDEDNDEAWVDLTLTAAELDAMLAEVRASQALASAPVKVFVIVENGVAHTVLASHPGVTAEVIALDKDDDHDRKASDDERVVRAWDECPYEVR